MFDYLLDAAKGIEHIAGTKRSDPMTSEAFNAQTAKHLSDKLVRNARFWIGTGMDPEAAFTKVRRESCAGVVPVVMARSELGLPVVA